MAQTLLKACDTAAQTGGFDMHRYKGALAKFPTGVAVVTGKGRDGRAVGLTVNSFVSVSLSPALVMWSLRRESSLYPEFSVAEHFVVNVLAEDQQWLAAQFSTRSSDRFDGVRHRSGLGGCAVLQGVAASFECEVASQQLIGDHLLLIGEVEVFDAYVRPPLILHADQPIAPRSPASALM
jgi:flavin reductase (DIM6/NTAB) family NADH-FMN oxidoreductase RutF